MKLKFDNYLLIITLGYLLFGFSIFFSASLGLLNRNEDKFFAVLNNQLSFGIFLGLTAFFLGVIIPYSFWKKMSYPILLIATILCILVFVPGIGQRINGAHSWIIIFGFSFQPSEILKYISILSLSAYYFHFYDKIQDIKYRIFPIIILSFCALLVFLEPDLGTSLIIFSGIFGIFMLIGGKLKEIIFMIVLGLLFAGAYIYFNPHAQNRIFTYNNQEIDLQGKSYQLNQGKIAIGSGGLFGYGYIQSAQKYYYLPEPIGDSVFAVLGEEFGFFGTIILFILLFSLSFRLLYVSYLSNDIFIKGVLGGMSIVLLSQSFLNIGSISGAIPLTGVPLPLVSHGSTSLILIMGMLGICTQMVGKTLKYEV